MTEWHARRFVLEYDSAVAMRYHALRRGFLEGISRLGPVLSLVFGTATFGTLMVGHATVAAVCGLLVAVINALNLSFGTAERARLHDSLFKRWAELRADLVNLGTDNDAELRKLELVRAKIDGDSPTQLAALSVMVENDEKVVRRSGQLYQVGKLQEALANWLTLPWFRPIPGSDAAEQQA